MIKAWEKRMTRDAASPRAMEVCVRTARREDLDSLIELLRQLFSIETDFEVSAARQRAGLLMMLDGCGKHRCLLAAELDGRVVGMVTAQTLVSTAEGGIAGMVEDLVVAEGHRSKGIGRLLIRAVESWARQRGVSRLQLLADRHNSPGLDFYRRQGWSATRLICLRKHPGG